MKINIIFGPPGTGKTTTLLKILADKLKQYAPEEIAYVSFTKEGVNQGKVRTIQQLNIQENRLLYFRTLHSIAFRMTNMKRSQVIGKKDYKLFSQKMGMNFTGYYTEELKHNDDRYLFFNILHRNNSKTAKRYLYGLDTKTLQHVAYNYKRFKEHYNIYDYTQMIEEFNNMNNALPVKIAIIDEAQDLSSLQWKMIWIAFRNCDELYIGGDDDQAIYEWSGADVEYFLNLNGNIKILKQSYRLPNTILPFANKILYCINKRVSKVYTGMDKKGKIYYIRSLSEINFNNDETWMILSRNRYFLKDVEVYIKSKGLLYIKFKEKSIKNDEINAIKLFEKNRHNPYNKDKIINNNDLIKLKRHLKNTYTLSKPWYDNFNWDIDKITYYRDIIGNKTKLNIFNIRIETIHSVKGDEADNIIILEDISKQVYFNLQTNPDSEHRVFYVASTRTKKNLYIMEYHTRYKYKFY